MKTPLPISVLAALLLTACSAVPGHAPRMRARLTDQIHALVGDAESLCYTRFSEVFCIAR